MFHDRLADRQAQSAPLNESISFFEPFKYYAELVLRDSAPCVGNAYSCFGRCRLVRNFDIALYGIFQCIDMRLLKNLLDAHRILLYQVGSCRVAFLERYAFRVRWAGIRVATFIYQVGEVAPDRDNSMCPASIFDKSSTSLMMFSSNSLLWFIRRCNGCVPQHLLYGAGGWKSR